ncbi:hypothetical protein [Pseudanabaena sp. ABRG5-3]|nr:hypothetical protein [Pseudanabaena sp. ABRG5-3]
MKSRVCLQSLISCVAIAFWLGGRSGTKMVILREPSREKSNTSDRH